MFNRQGCLSYSSAIKLTGSSHFCSLAVRPTASWTTKTVSGTRPDTDVVVQVGKVVGEGGPQRVVRQLPVEAGHVPRDAGEILEAALRGAARTVAAVLCDPDLPGPA
jgi:hypothetical protein